VTQEPLLDSPEFSIKTRRWLIVLCILATAAFLSMAAVSITVGRVRFFPEVGFARLVECAADIPYIGVCTPFILALENVVTAAPFAFAALCYWRYLGPPDPVGREVLVYRARQARHTKWVYLLAGVALLSCASIVLLTLRLPLMDALAYMDAGWYGLTDGHIFSHGPAGTATVAHAVATGALELLGIHCLARAFWVGFMPFPRAFIVVIRDPGMGVTSRIVIGDGPFRRSGHLIIPHGQILQITPRSSILGQSLLDLTAIEITYRGFDGEVRTVSVPSLPHPKIVQELVQQMNNDVLARISANDYAMVRIWQARAKAATASSRYASTPSPVSP
jgi:hypothetical protein